MWVANYPIRRSESEHQLGPSGGVEDPNRPSDTYAMRVRITTIMAALLALALIPSSAFAAKKKPTFKITTSSVSASEAGQATITVTRQGDRVPDVTVDYTTIDKPTAGAGTADPNVDYTPASGTLDFPANVTTKTFTIPVTDDQVSDPNETVKFKIQNPANVTSASQGAALGNPSTGTLTIVDNDGAGTIDFSQPTYTVLESGGFATITVNRQSATNISETVHYATSAAATAPATAGSDYSATSGTVTFPSGVMSASFQVPILDDSNFEGPENIAVSLSAPTSSLGTTPALGPNNAAGTTLTINDDDVPVFKFSQASYSVNEDHPGQATITVNRSGATNIATDVNYATSNGSATAGPANILNGSSDYTATSGTLHF